MKKVFVLYYSLLTRPLFKSQNHPHNEDKMNYFAIQVKTRSEQKYIQLFKSLYPEITLTLHFPQRQLNIKKGGQIKPANLAVFPGYIFIEAESDSEIKACQWEFRRTEGFYRFLKSNRDITPLSNRDLELVLHFINNPGSAGVSRVYFNEKSRVIVVDGPLSGLEGRIVKVDKRKGRAKIKLDLFDDSFTIDLAFEVIRSVTAENQP